MINTDNLCDDIEVLEVVQSEDLWVYNKLQIAKLQGLACGPAGVPVPYTGQYIVRPIMNFSGMGIKAEIKTLVDNDCHNIEPGMFWCELLQGDHISVDYNYGAPVQGYRAYRDNNNPLYMFNKWTRIKSFPIIPPFLWNISNKYSTINIEFIGNKVIEVHLRGSPDPQYEEIIPVWSSNPFTLEGYTFISRYEDCDGYLDDPRLGFWVK